MRQRRLPAAHAQHPGHRPHRFLEVITRHQPQQIKAATAIRGAMVADKAAALLMVGKAVAVFAAAARAALAACNGRTAQIVQAVAAYAP